MSQTVFGYKIYIRVTTLEGEETARLNPDFEMLRPLYLTLIFLNSQGSLNQTMFYSHI